MIALVTGPPGSGKSFFAVRKIAAALEDGKYVATNVELAPDAADRVARANWVRWLVPGRRAKAAREINRRLHVAGSLDELFAVRLRGTKEGRGVMVLDEAHAWLNARNWTASDREGIVRFLSQHRKLGWDIYLIAQDPELIDKQVRRLFEYHIHLRNAKRFKVLGVPVVPVNVFLAIWTWHAAGRVIVKRELNRLNWSRHLYATTQLMHGLQDDIADPIWLPKEAAV